MQQTEKAYLKHPAVFENRKASYGKRKASDLRFVRSVGLGFKTPAEVGMMAREVEVLMIAFQLSGDHGQLHRQEVPLHWPGQHPRPYPYRNRCLPQDEAVSFKFTDSTSFCFLLWNNLVSFGRNLLIYPPLLGLFLVVCSTDSLYQHMRHPP